jgi:hypothetical protein
MSELVILPWLSADLPPLAQIKAEHQQLTAGQCIEVYWFNLKVWRTAKIVGTWTSADEYAVQGFFTSPECFGLGGEYLRRFLAAISVPSNSFRVRRQKFGICWTESCAFTIVSGCRDNPTWPSQGTPNQRSRFLGRQQGLNRMKIRPRLRRSRIKIRPRAAFPR